MLRAAPAPRTRAGLAAAVAVLLGLGTACGTPARGPDPSAAVSASLVEPATLGPGELGSAPVGPAVLDLTGRIGAADGPRRLRLDLATLERLGLWRVRVHEPFVGRDTDFQGVWLADLLHAAEADDDSTGVHLTALDDYQSDLDTADVRSGAVFLATGTGTGAPLPIDEGGPIRIVLTGDIPSGATEEKWIWSVAAIEVR